MPRQPVRDDMLLVKVDSRGIKTNISLPPLVLPVSRRRRIILEAEQAENDLADLKRHLERLQQQHKTLLTSVDAKRQSLQDAKNQSQLVTSQTLSMDIQASKSHSDFQELVKMLASGDMALAASFTEWCNLVRTSLDVLSSMSGRPDDDDGSYCGDIGHVVGGVESVMRHIDEVDNQLQQVLTRLEDKDSKFWFDVDSAVPAATTSNSDEGIQNNDKDDIVDNKSSTASMADTIQAFLQEQELILVHDVQNDEEEQMELKNWIQNLQGKLDVL
ncbi:hypothetical protein SeMB42_g00555 [Synchytrium endobioticum]|uniref:Uncharacterized protein n=1 Tax=Synchytrium endobioticum TaxID=286115 RepID=A0A507DR47_9FUNG|nr:hypothetical protein SeLEV6574_g01163 [Synchytrium endobioticum]TPX53921.1 hypothetical protein SeMB42_g00555 [Synchytrium endobioticum]